MVAWGLSPSGMYGTGLHGGVHRLHSREMSGSGGKRTQATRRPGYRSAGSNIVPQLLSAVGPAGSALFLFGACRLTHASGRGGSTADHGHCGAEGAVGGAAEAPSE